MMKTQQVSDWHERQCHRTGGPTVGERQADEAELELQMANASVHELRRAKMRELVARDDLRWETELNAMGLTVSKDNVREGTRWVLSPTQRTRLPKTLRRGQRCRSRDRDHLS